MKLYLDDDLASPLLARLLRSAGHDVQLPGDVGLAGKADAVHFAHAVRQGRACLTRNYGDFQNLHDLVGAVQGHHPGILVVRQDNDPKRDLKNRDIVRAIGKLQAAAVPIPDQYIILNVWR
jgi:predicted nuclease of predicted toxin-antitoxin system